MIKLTYHKSVKEFLEVNDSHLKSHFYVYQTIYEIVEKHSSGKFQIRNAITIKEDENYRILVIVNNPAILIFSSSWNNKLIKRLADEIKLDSMQNWYVSGNKTIINKLLEIYRIDPAIVREKNFYECRAVVENLRLASGEMKLASMEHVNEVVNLCVRFRKEENTPKESVNLNQIKSYVLASILNHTFYVWIDQQTVKSICQCYDLKKGFKYITYFYTDSNFRSKGYGKCLLWKVTSKELIKSDQRIGLFTEAQNVEANKSILYVGYENVSEWMKVYLKG